MNSSQRYLDLIGCRQLPPRTVPFDPGYDARTLEGHIDQSRQFMHSLKLSMACWIIADQAATRHKLDTARRFNIRTVAGGGPFEIACAMGQLEPYLDLCAELGFSRIEAGEGFTDLKESPERIINLARCRGLSVQFELGRKADDVFDQERMTSLAEKGRLWLDAGAEQLVVEARESAADVGLFNASGTLNTALADLVVEKTGADLALLQFEAPNKPSQFALLNHFGPEVILSNVRLEEVLRVEVYRHGLHADAFLRGNLSPNTA